MLTVVALLVALLLPTLGRARVAAQLVTCASNQHQTGVAAAAFKADHGRLWAFYNGTADWGHETYASIASMLVPRDDGSGPSYLPTAQTQFCPLYDEVSHDESYTRWEADFTGVQRPPARVAGTYVWAYPHMPIDQAPPWARTGEPSDPWGYRPAIDESKHKKGRSGNEAILAGIPRPAWDVLVLEHSWIAHPLYASGTEVGPGEVSTPHLNALMIDGSVRVLADTDDTTTTRAWLWGL